MSQNFSLPHLQVSIKKKANQPLTLRIIVTRRIRRAVDRNRIRRVVREFFRTKRTLLPGNLVLCRIHPSAAKIKNELLFQELNKIL